MDATMQMLMLMLLSPRADDGGKPPPLEGGGSGRSLPFPLLATAAACSVFATVLSIYSVVLQLRAYYKPTLQRYTVRILVMVPIYAIASATSLFSLRSAFVVDVLRDLYEAVTLLSLFNLMIAYLGGERSILVLAHSREPVRHPWPVRLFYPPLDMSNPHTFLALKRGVLQYVQIKPVLAIATIATKLTGTYHEGKLGLNYYTLEQIIYNFSVFLSLYCLAMFWSCLSPDLASFRVTPKFICIKGIIFFSFWQGLAVSIVVALGLITRIGPVADPQYLSIAITDILICLEMPFFAIGHLYAFSARDYIEKSSYYQARLPAKYALRDSIGIYDMMSDAVDTIKGGMRHRYNGISSPSSEEIRDDDSAEQKTGEEGMRYTNGAPYKKGRRRDRAQRTWGSFLTAPISSFRSWQRERQMASDGYAPLLSERQDGSNQERRNDDLEQGKSPRSRLSKRCHVSDDSSSTFSSDNDDNDSDDADDKELTAKLRSLAKEGVVGTLDFLTGHRFVNNHPEDNRSMVSCHFSLHEGDEEEEEEEAGAAAADAGTRTPRLDDTEVMYAEARALARENEHYPSLRMGQQEEMLRKWIIEQDAALRAAAAASQTGEEEERRGAGSAVAAVLPWVKRRRQREEELIGRMRTIREKRVAKREARRRDRRAARAASSTTTTTTTKDASRDAEGGATGPEGQPSSSAPSPANTASTRKTPREERRAARSEAKQLKKEEKRSRTADKKGKERRISVDGASGSAAADAASSIPGLSSASSNAAQ
ncbi:hypothetical protein OC842_006868 [Tilletia horrida]|uniref:DUF300-domain-containing protein n=1 Tax=Tilletia horrida TaxID=155126 RepID=A0AAN6G739_9BASI|nr:hypothetical protein OC842_006868 [Tilletia horrida]